VPAATRGDTQEKIKVEDKSSSESTTVKVPRGPTASIFSSRRKNRGAHL
jgi:hypothetical protein